MTNFQLSSDGLGINASAETLQQTYSHIAQRSVDALDDAPLRFAFNGKVMHDVVVMHSQSSAVYAERTNALLADGNDNWILHLVTEGKALIKQKGGQESLCTAGMVYVEPADNPGTFYLDDIRFFDISLPQQLIEPWRVDEHRFLRKGVSIDAFPEMQLLLDYVAMLTNDVRDYSPEMLALLRSHVLDLSVVALGGAQDSIEVARNRGVKAARLCAIKNDVLSHLSDSDLSIGKVAGRLGISPQYIRKLLNAEGTTFSDLVGHNRIDHIYRRLNHPLYRHWSISRLAYDLGFNNLSQFNKLFKARHGISPSDVRATKCELMGE